ncbi:RNAse E [Aliiroseovarius crassostreae]|uniref:Ribonuclease E n=1 Tax=Aliiroseovarius crassostreae TaxID=154981 RepID=A0A0P7KK11_9RHOB|nr:ribonuclease E/G [Aliiroseovarius crassostreae]KPN62234.1 ribonuclease [Aliiroseovarius crassostreae]SFU52886.1 RNAse E [Aliiroseovarius crassostreae]
MPKKMLIDATHAEETRVVVVDGNKVEEFDFESENKRQLAGNIYLAKVTRVEPSLQAAFVDYGGNRHGFLAFSEIHPDYYQIPVADRQALLEEERAYAEAQAAEDEKPKSRRRRRSKSKSKAEETKSADAVATKEVETLSEEPVENSASGMDVIDLDEGGADTLEGHSPMDLVDETPVAEPAEDATDTPAAETPVETPAQEGADAGDVAENAAEDQAADLASDAQDADGDHADDGHGEDDGDEDDPLEADEKDDQIERVADDDSSEDIRPRRKPRQKRYKIQEVVKVRQIMLVQVVKEERGNKGAALTTYLSLAGRYCVLMPNTARGGGISRKITNITDRKKLKEIAAEIDVPQGAGLIIRTAGAKRTKTEIKRDYEYLQRLWEQIRTHTLESIAPAKIYEEGNLIKRTIRDLYSREIDEVFVEGAAGYRTAKDFMKMIMPSHAKNVKHYQDQMPLFARYQVESYLSGMFNPTVQLKSGGYIVIGVTEALVAIDVNSGRATKEGSIEETALKTNLEAAEEVARQLRLRDLAGLIVIDFIDMDERRNNTAVEKRMKDKLKTDRARIQVGRISGFGLMEMSRQRLRPGMIEATTQPCNHCHGTGLIRSDDNLALNILRQLEEEGVRRRSREVLVKAPVGIVNFLMNNKREHIAQIEARYGMAVRIEADPFLISPDFAIEKFKTATRVVPEAAALVSADASLMSEIDEVEEAEVISEEAPTEASPATTGDEEQKPKKRRRRRRRRRSSSSENGENGENGETTDGSGENGDVADVAEDAKASDGEAPGDAASEGADAGGNASPAEAADEAEKDAAKPRKTSGKSSGKTAKRSSTSKRKAAAPETGGETGVEAGEESAENASDAVSPAEDKPKKTTRKSSSARKKSSSSKAKEEAELASSEQGADAVTGEATEAASDAPAEGDVKPKKTTRKRTTRKKKAAEVVEPAPDSAEQETSAEAVVAAEPVSDTVDVSSAEPTPAPEDGAVAETPSEEPSVAPSEPVAEPVTEEVSTTAVKEDTPPKPKRKGWWSLGQ